MFRSEHVQEEEHCAVCTKAENNAKLLPSSLSASESQLLSALIILHTDSPTQDFAC